MPRRSGQAAVARGGPVRWGPIRSRCHRGARCAIGHLDRETGAFLGRAGLHPWPQWDEVERGCVLARRAQGRVLATEAARAWLRVAVGELGLHRVTAVIPRQHSESGVGRQARLPSPPRGRDPVRRPCAGPRTAQPSGRTSRPIASWARGA
ncbi:GNAT family N-acetyltransferase [Geodermatophilus sp. URMC 61]|uniref:GNAT family N-acetyltransferase n=1 Tax=Geodermatophilus sp. URMC 61 TaxID=3423411 RepID=UPI00406C3DCE